VTWGERSRFGWSVRIAGGCCPGCTGGVPNGPSRRRPCRSGRTGSCRGRELRSRRRCSGTPRNCIQCTNSWVAARVRGPTVAGGRSLGATP
jgi:hypothetical protein